MARTKAKKMATPIPKKKASSPILKKKVISKTKQATKAKEAEKPNPYKKMYVNSVTTRNRVRFQDVEEPKAEDKKKEKSRKRVKEEESEKAKEAEKAGKRSKGGKGRAATKKKREEEVEEEEEREEEVPGFFVKCPRVWPEKIMESPDDPDPEIVYYDDYDESQHIRLPRRTCTLDGIPFSDIFGSVSLRVTNPDAPRKPVVRNLMADFAAARARGEGEEESEDEPPPAADATPAADAPVETVAASQDAATAAKTRIAELEQQNAELVKRVAELEQKTKVQGGSGDAEKPPTFALTAARTHSGRRTE